jgi:hypothetical protein
VLDSGSTRAHRPAVRVAQIGDRLEVVDGFKRLARWEAAGATSVPVAIESTADLAQANAALLLANAPPRMVTAMDEARAVASLAEDGLSIAGIAATLRRRRVGWRVGWVWLGNYPVGTRRSVGRRALRVRAQRPATARVDLECQVDEPRGGNPGCEPTC